MYKVLLFGLNENPGGVESFIYNYYKYIDKTVFSFDFLCNTHNKVAYEDEIKKLGGKFIHIAMRSEHPILYKKELTNFFKKNAKNYDAIWVNVCSLANVDYLKYAKKYGIKRRIIHSHNSRNMDNRIRKLLHEKNKKNIENLATDYWACSNEAAEWFYPNDLLPKVKIIKNAIEITKYEFDVKKRNAIREALKVDDNTYVIGNVGRLHFQKNQKFAIDILAEYIKLDSNCKLVFVGQGEDLDSLKALAAEKDLNDKIFFAGVQDDIPAWLSAFDLFLFPSLFEGLSIAALEAQANGLPMLASSDVIAKETKVNENMTFLSLSNSAKIWADKIYDIKNTTTRIDSDKVKVNFIKNGYEIRNEVKVLERNLING